MAPRFRSTSWMRSLSQEASWKPSLDGSSSLTWSKIESSSPDRIHPPTIESQRSLSRLSIVAWPQPDDRGHRLEVTMDITQTSKESARGGLPTQGTVDTKLEVVVVPVSDVQRAKTFYSDLG